MAGKTRLNGQRFAASLRSWRLAAGLSRRGLAGRLAVSVFTVACWEAGWTRPKIPLISSLRRELGVDETTFFQVCEAGFTDQDKE